MLEPGNGDGGVVTIEHTRHGEKKTDTFHYSERLYLQRHCSDIDMQPILIGKGSLDMIAGRIVIDAVSDFIKMHE